MTNLYTSSANVITTSNTSSFHDIKLGYPLCHTNVTKFLNRVTYVENGTRNLRDALLDYTWKHASLRSKSDEVARSLAHFAQDEEFNTTTKLALDTTSDIIAAVGDYSRIHVKKLEDNVIPLLSSYDHICKKIKGKLRRARQVQQKEELKKKCLSKFHEKRCNSDDLRQAELEWEKASRESSRLLVLSNEEMLKFETSRAEDMKRMLEQFFRNEMALHAKALELYTDAYDQVSHLNAEADIQILKSGMTLRGIQPILEHKSKSDMEKKSGIINPPTTTTTTTAPLLDNNHRVDVKCSKGEVLSHLSHPSLQPSSSGHWISAPHNATTPAPSQDAHADEDPASSSPKPSRPLKFYKYYHLRRKSEDRRSCPSMLAPSSSKKKNSDSISTEESPRSHCNTLTSRRVRDAPPEQPSKTKTIYNIRSPNHERNPTRDHIVSKYKYPVK